MNVFSVLALICGFIAVVSAKSVYCFIFIALTVICCVVAFIADEDLKHLCFVGIAASLLAAGLFIFLTISSKATQSINTIKDSIDSDLEQFYDIDPSTATDSMFNDMLNGMRDGLY